MAALDNVLGEEVVVDRTWLQMQGFDRPLVDYYLRSGKLESVGRGIYRKPGPPLKWQNIVFSLSKIGYRIHVGHLTALKYHGYIHFFKLGGNYASASLYGLIETAKASGLEPYRYLRHIFERLPHAATEADYFKLLPFKIQKK